MKGNGNLSLRPGLSTFEPSVNAQRPQGWRELSRVLKMSGKQGNGGIGTPHGAEKHLVGRVTSFVNLVGCPRFRFCSPMHQAFIFSLIHSFSCQVLAISATFSPPSMPCCDFTSTRLAEDSAHTHLLHSLLAQSGAICRALSVSFQETQHGPCSQTCEFIQAPPLPVMRPWDCLVDLGDLVRWL